MSAFVVDASIVAKWFFPERDTPAAAALLVPGNILHAPDLLYSEIGNIVWKRISRKELDQERAHAILEQLTFAPLTITPVSKLMATALRIAYSTRRTFYDSTYLALAVEEKCSLVTADTRLFNALRDTTLSAYIVAVGEE